VIRLWLTALERWVLAAGGIADLMNVTKLLQIQPGATTILPPGSGSIIPGRKR